jgi:endonuclease-3
MAQGLVERFDGEVPTDLADLVTLAGVGRKTGNVVRSVAFGLPGLPVDTHVGRLSRKWQLTSQDDPVKAEAELCALLPPAEWGAYSLRTILHGRRVCDAKRPNCAECGLEPLCPASLIPRKGQRPST